VLRSLRAPDGGPALHVRLIAAVIVLGMTVLAAPVVVPLLRWLVDAVWF
jgi:hypothetical protein